MNITNLDQLCEMLTSLDLYIGVSNGRPVLSVKTKDGTRHFINKNYKTKAVVHAPFTGKKTKVAAI